MSVHSVLTDVLSIEPQFCAKSTLKAGLFGHGFLLNYWGWVMGLWVWLLNETRVNWTVHGKWGNAKKVMSKLLESDVFFDYCGVGHSEFVLAKQAINKECHLRCFETFMWEYSP